MQGLDVFACASRQLSEFLGWLQEQEYYENTTIVIMGDHISGDSAMITDAGIDPSFPRRTFIAILNAADGCTETNRVYTAMDMYPTTLAAMGAEIEGNRLGLGVNLFSEEPTLPEEYGVLEFDGEMWKSSTFYEEYLIGDEAGMVVHP